VRAADSRFRLAKGLRELADHSSEVELRNTLSRSYYSIYHAAKGYLDNVDHHNIAEELGKLNPPFGTEMETLQILRARADYDPTFVEREFGGNLEAFRIAVQEHLEQGREIFQWISAELDRAH